MFDFYKSFQENQKLAQEVATTIAGATVEFTKAVTEANTLLANTVTKQVTEAYKNLETKFPGFDIATKSNKKSVE
jgi:AmiR/NasT family two-component response regulator